MTLRIAYLKGTSDLTLAKAKGSLDKALATQSMKVGVGQAVSRSRACVRSVER
ncbi:MAG: Alkanesulfonates-binding protein [uncultured Caballeronia sp.]|nr:MAG: Alkanesulfonates-binding protein [uncultured Caballeronia sp.]